MSNKETTPIPSTLLRLKLERLLGKLQKKADPKGNRSSLDTQEMVIAEAMAHLSHFYKTLPEPIYVPVRAVIDSPPNYQEFNDNIQGISDDLTVLFGEFENLEAVILGYFNYMVSRLNLLNRKMKQTASSLADFILLSEFPTREALFFGDTFSNLSKIENNSPLLNATQCEINQVEGIITLPIRQQTQSSVETDQLPVINSSSNGVRGNNQEVGKATNSDISKILDNNADTWFEYERVVSTDDGVALVLDFTVNLGSEKIVNFVRINPNNFGTKTQVEILAIDTSTDGRSFISIKDDIPIAGFLTEDEENIFVLAPSTSKYAGQGLYTFTPRKAKYVHFTLRQSTPYNIQTSSGLTKQRYAIGIRDVEIKGLRYEAKGEVISTEFTIGDTVSKAVVLSNQSPLVGTVSNLASIKHYLSPDNGLSWHEIRPKESQGVANIEQEVPELLTFNGVEEDSIQTERPVITLRYKALLERNTDGFTNNSSELAQVIENNTELHSPPLTTPFNITLQQTPIENTLSLLDPQFGSRGKEDVKYQIAVGNGSQLSILLPFKPLHRDFAKEETSPGSGVWNLVDRDPQDIYVNGVEWTRGALTSTNKNYRINFEEGRITFGDGTNGAAVPDGATVSMTLSEERVFPERGEGHQITLNYPVARDQKRVELYRVDPSTTKVVVLKKNANRHPLSPDIIDGSLEISDATVFASIQPFVDGDVELTGTGEYSVDYTNGVLYSYDSTNALTDTTVKFKYYPRTKLTNSQWKFLDSGSISLSDNVYKTHKASRLTIPSSKKYLNLAHLGVVRGTVSFSGSYSGIFDTEVEYVDGRTELLGYIAATEEIDALTNVSAGEIRAIPFKIKVVTDTSFSVTFTNTTIFASEKGSYGAISSTGDYYVDRSAGNTGVVYVKLADDVDEPGYISYYYSDPQANLTGRYSINYQTGEVFTYTQTTAGIYVDYQYTDYRAKYDIARYIDDEDWTFDASDRKLTIKDREILKGQQIPQQSGGTSGGVKKFYQVSYQYVKENRQDINELEPYFSPILKDYSIKVITQSRLI